VTTTTTERLRFTRRVTGMEISPTLAVMNRAHELVANGHDRRCGGRCREGHRPIGKFHARVNGNPKATLDWIDRQAGASRRARGREV